MKKVVKFISLDRSSKLLLLESYLYLAWARILKRIPFAKLSPSLGAPMQETSREPGNTDTLKAISKSINLMSRYTWWESQCLVKAIAAMKMLKKRKIDCTLYLGTAKDEDGTMIAHAWVRSGTYYVTGKEGMERFTVVGKFAKTTGGMQHAKGNAIKPGERS